MNFKDLVKEEAYVFCVHDYGAKERCVAIIFALDMGISKYSIRALDGAIRSDFATLREAINWLHSIYDSGYVELYHPTEVK